MDSIELLEGTLQGIKGFEITETKKKMESVTYGELTPTSASGTVTLVNANNIELTRTELYVAHADSITVGDTTFTNNTFHHIEKF